MQKRNNTTHSLRSVRHARIRACVIGTPERPRLSVYRSNRFISAQVIDDASGVTLVSAQGRKTGGTKLAQAKEVGKTISLRAQEKGIKTIVFDRGGYTYATRIKALADAAREGGLIF